jgi:predicted alpha/beta superfamily hydrolase
MADSSNWRRVERHADRTIFRYRSAALGDELEVTVAPPTLGDGPAPVVFVLDPFLTFETVLGWSRVYGLYSHNQMPPALVVGIGHPTGDDEARFMALRVRDLTPTGVTERDWRPPMGAGQGPQLLEAIAAEIVPFIEANFAASQDRTIIGWSLGGLFTVYALFHEPKVFSRYLAFSPSLGWEGRLALEWERDWAAAHGDLDARVFMAIGSEEQAPGNGWLSEDFSDELLAWFRMVTNFRTFTRRLKARKYPSLTLNSVVFPDEYHMTVYPAAVARGLVKLFPPGAPPKPKAKSKRR